MQCARACTQATMALLSFVVATVPAAAKRAILALLYALVRVQSFHFVAKSFVYTFTYDSCFESVFVSRAFCRMTYTGADRVPDMS